MLEEFKSDLEVIYSFIDHVATDMDTDIVAKFHTENNVPLAYFYQGGILPVAHREIRCLVFFRTSEPSI